LGNLAEWVDAKHMGGAAAETVASLGWNLGEGKAQEGIDRSAVLISLRFGTDSQREQDREAGKGIRISPRRRCTMRRRSCRLGDGSATDGGTARRHGTSDELVLLSGRENP